jgi:hypothetical protein
MSAELDKRGIGFGVVRAALARGTMAEDALVRAEGTHREYGLARRALRQARLDELDSEKVYGPFRVYARSKLVVILINLEFARRLRGRVAVDAVFRPLVLGIDEGAEPTVELAVSPEREGLTGLYFARYKARELPRRIGPCRARPQE